MSHIVIKVRLVFTNKRAARALCHAAELLEEAAEEMPWRDDLKEAAKALRYARKKIRMETCGRE